MIRTMLEQLLNQVLVASDLIRMASNLRAMASNLDFLVQQFKDDINDMMLN